MKGMRYNARVVAGWKKGGGHAPFQKIRHFLGGSLLHASSGAAGGRLQGFLVGHARQHAVLSAEGLRIFRMHAHDKSGVGKGRVPPGQGHAVDHHFIIFRGSRNDESSGAHAKGVDSPVPNGGGDGVARRRELVRPLLARVQMVLPGIHKCLRMLNAYAHGKGFLLQDKPVRQKHAVHVAGTVPGSQQNGVCFKFPAVRTSDSAHAAAVRGTEQMLHPGVEVDFPARLENGFPDGLDDIGQQVGAYVGMGVRQDFPRSAMSYKCLINIPHGTALGGTGKQLAVGERARAPFSEAVVGILNHPALPHDGRQVKPAGGDILPPLQHHGFDAQFQTAQGGKHSGGPKSHDQSCRNAGPDGRIIPRRHMFRRQRPIHACQ